MSKPKIAQKTPIVMEVEPGTHAWRSCGQSSKQPYCDGSHSDLDFTPIIETVSEKKT